MFYGQRRELLVSRSARLSTSMNSFQFVTVPPVPPPALPMSR